MSTPPTDPVSILSSGITSILGTLNALIPIWGATAENLDTTAQAVTQLASATQAQKVEVLVSQMIIPLLEEYKGTKEKAAYFIRLCNQYFTCAGITKDDAKIATALALMKGDNTSKWAKNQLQLIQDEASNALTTWKNFSSEFMDHFGDRTPSFTAASKIKLLMQGNKTAETFNTDFNNLKNDTQWNEPTLINCYYSGLNPDLLHSLYHCDPMPVTLKEWQAKADLLDKQEREHQVTAAQASSARHFTKSQQPVPTFTHKPFTPISKPIPLPPPPTATRDPNTMDVDHAPRRPPLTCFKCGKVRHIARDCRSNIVIKVVEVGEMSDEQKRSIAAQLHEQGF